MPGIFITGTGTGVGKTYIACGIARQLRRRKLKVIPRKPVESGCSRQHDKLVPRDAASLREASGYPGTLAEVCPWPLAPPISPARAARLTGTVISIGMLAAACRPQSENDYMLVEGAGGFYSPLAEDGLNADLAEALQLPLLLVAADRLGAINDVLLTTAAIRSRGLPLRAIVLNTTEDNSDEQMDNLADLRERLDVPVFGTGFNSEKLPEALIDLLILQSN